MPPPPPPPPSSALPRALPTPIPPPAAGLSPCVACTPVVGLASHVVCTPFPLPLPALPRALTYLHATSAHIVGLAPRVAPLSSSHRWLCPTCCLHATSAPVAGLAPRVTRTPCSCLLPALPSTSLERHSPSPLDFTCALPALPAAMMPRS
ncbi:hypothetical protein EDB86DRAFT_432277 [Lactarius hatsudake]|nr:hypothetical protein EDB86DRAFT_432277 [Lactarius hatsudake]